MSRRRYPLAKVYTLLEPGPTVLLATSDKGRPNVMTMSWTTMLDFEPPLVGCVVSNRNYSFKALKATKECVIAVPGRDIAEKVVAVGNVSGEHIDKFARFGLTATPASMVAAPLIDDCYANLECRVVDTKMVAKYCFFVLEVVKAWVNPQLAGSRTIHHSGYGNFMVAGERIKLKSAMR